MKNRIYLLSVSALCACALSAHAQYTVDGYQLETLTGTLNALPGTPSLVPWWGSESSAETFATGYSLVAPAVNQTDIFPFSNSTTGVNEVEESYSGGHWSQTLVQGNPTATQSFIEDSVTVPEPSSWVAGALLACPFGFQGLRLLRKSRQTA